MRAAGVAAPSRICPSPRSARCSADAAPLLWASDPRVYGTGDTLLEEVDHKYDAWANLVETDSYPIGSGSPNVTRYAVDGWDPALAGTTGNTRFNVWADLNGSNGLVTRYFHGDQPDQLFARQDAGVQYGYLTDYQGSVRDVLDNSGNVLVIPRQLRLDGPAAGYRNGLAV